MYYHMARNFGGLLKICHLPEFGDQETSEQLQQFMTETLHSFSKLAIHTCTEGTVKMTQYKLGNVAQGHR